MSAQSEAMPLGYTLRVTHLFHVVKERNGSQEPEEYRRSEEEDYPEWVSKFGNKKEVSGRGTGV